MAKARSCSNLATRFFGYDVFLCVVCLVFLLHLPLSLGQGGGKRKGSIAVYLEPWHADVVAFLDLKKNHGNELERARDLFYAMWIPDLFMQVLCLLLYHPVCVCEHCGTYSL